MLKSSIKIFQSFLPPPKKSNQQMPEKILKKMYNFQKKITKLIKIVSK